MLVRRQKLPSHYKPIDDYKTTLYWCSDGWVYDTFTKTRRRYQTNGTLFTMEEEPTTRISFSDVQQSETLFVTVYQESPRIWMEEGDGWSDSFCVVVDGLENIGLNK
jgi:hypothetical protein